MKSIAKLKDDARKHEQKEEWDKAIQAYLGVLEIGEEGDGAELDLPLYNRVGDLYVRLGRASDAVKYYEQAADRYAEAGLYNNAIALCNKALRYDAGRLELFKKLGSFSAQQGFFTDARRWYLDYAEKSIKRGQLDAAFGALSEYANTNDDPEIRELLARQLREHGRREAAVEEFKRAYSLRVSAGQNTEAEGLRAEVLALDPNAVLSDTPTLHHTTAARQEQLPGFVDIDRVAAPPPPAPMVAPPAPVQEAEPEPLVIEQTGLGGMDTSDAGDYGTIELDSGFGTGSSTDDVAPLDVGLEAPLGIEEEDFGDISGFDLPQLEDDAAAEEDEPMALPTFDDFDTSETEDVDDVLTELPMLGIEEEPAEFAEPLPGFDGVESNAELPATETEIPSLDIGDFELDEVGMAGEPLPTLDVAFGEEAAVDESELEETDSYIDDLLGVEPVASEEAAPEADEPVVEAAFQQPVIDEPFVEEPVAAEPALEEPVIEEPLVEEPVIEEPLVEEPVVEEPVIPEAVIPEPVISEPVIPEPVIPEPVIPEPVVVEEPAAAAPEPPAAPEPVAAAPEPLPAAPAAAPPAKKEYIDLASLLEDDDDETEDSTRFVVAEKPPTGDEEQDFADMLEQFKAKISETIPKEDAGSHYDLGIAFKEMGLIDEAIGEFQTALRAGQEKLKVYEELGSCFVMKGQYSVAITILNRASQMPFNDEQELLGVYYNLGRAYEELGQRAEAKSAYEKIVAIDIGFQDTTSRLSQL